MATYPPSVDWTTGTGTTGGFANVIWASWNTASTTTLISNNTTWGYWTTGGTTVSNSSNIVWDNWAIQPIIATYPVRTPEEIEADEAKARVARAEYEERAAKQRTDAAQAVQKAETLLHAHLNERQRRYLAAHGVFRVKAKSGRWYEIGRGHHGKLKELNAEGKPVNSLCVYATGGCPEADQMLAQKLYLEAAEEELRRVAYITKVPAYA